MATYTTKMYDRFDKICELRYGDTDQKIVEYVLGQNPGLERHGILLPPGIAVYLPDRPKLKKQLKVIQKYSLI